MKARKVLIVLLGLMVVFLSVGIVTAQEIIWLRQFGALNPADDWASAVDYEGNVYVAGRTYGTFGGQTGAEGP